MYVLSSEESLLCYNEKIFPFYSFSNLLNSVKNSENFRAIIVQ